MGLPGATGLQGLVGAKVIVLPFQLMKTIQQPQQLKKDKRGFLKMAKTVLETQRCLILPHISEAVAQTMTQENQYSRSIRSSKSVHLWLKGLSVMDFISGHLLSLKNTLKHQWHCHQYF